MKVDAIFTMAFRTNPTDRARFEGIREDLNKITEMLTDDAVMRNAMTGQMIKVAEIQRVKDILYMLANAQCPLWEVLTKDDIFCGNSYEKKMIG